MRYSELATFMHCPQKYFNEYVRSIEKIEKAETEHDRDWGRAVHKGLEVWYKTGLLAEAHSAFEKEYPEQLKEEDLAKTKEGGIKLLNNYVEFYRAQDLNWEVIEAEHEGTFAFEDVQWTVHIDLIARNRQSGDIYFWDHKTSGRSPDFNFWKLYDISSQLTAYTAYVKEKFGSCAGAIINALIIGHRQRAYKGEPAGHWSKFERNIFNRTPRQIEAWKQNVKEWMKKLEFSRDQHLWPTHDSQLCNWCEFRELCISGDDEEIREVLYQPKQKRELNEIKNNN